MKSINTTHEEKRTMPRNAYTPRQKREIIKKAKTIGAAAAAKESGVSYNTVLRWMKENEKPLPQNTQMGFDLEIATIKTEIEKLTKQLSEKKAELKTLLKEKEKEEKAEKAACEAAEMKALVRKIVESGKPVDEVIELLRS